jgi:hypothetical protein
MQNNCEQCGWDTADILHIISLFLFAKMMRLVIQSVRKRTLCLCASIKIQDVPVVTPLPFLSTYLLKLSEYIKLCAVI